MGCDIHMVAEYLSNGEWFPHFTIGICEGAAQPIWLDRNYTLFASLGHVPRSHVTQRPMYPLRGMPNDAHVATRKGLSDIDYHSHSWLYFGEAQFAATVASASLDRRSSQLSDWLDYAGMAYVAWEHQRIVFAFDN